jgi:hypothetical protein
MQRFNVWIPPSTDLNQEARKVERVVPNALSWVRCHRLGDKPIHLQILLCSQLGPELLPERLGDLRSPLPSPRERVRVTTIVRAA